MGQQIVNLTSDRRQHSLRRRINQMENIPRSGPFQQDSFKELLVHAVDGGQTTTRTRIYDQVRGVGGWPPVYDGRAIVNKTFVEAELQGVPLETVKQRYEKAMQEGDFQRLTAYA